MYQQFFELRERPFDLTSDPRCLLLTVKHQEGLSNLEYGLTWGTGITLLLGEAGTGKTTLLRAAYAQYRQRHGGKPIVWAHISNPMLSRYEFFDSIAHAFRLGDDAAGTKSRFLRHFEGSLNEHRDCGAMCVLVVDEAQSAPYELLEEVRLLANIEDDRGKLLRVILAGQPAFGDTLADPRLCQLKQRIGLWCSLPALTLRETAGYIAHRITLAGGDPARIFTRDAVLTIHERSKGIPRTINVICENALITGFAADARPVDADIVLEVCEDFDLRSGEIARPRAALAEVAAPPARRGVALLRRPRPEPEIAPESSRVALSSAKARWR